MQRRAYIRRLLGLLLVPAGLGAVACNTNAVGVNECRDVEYARCRASVPCGVIEEDEVTECERFYRDHCLHGMRGKELPSADEHKDCLDLIAEAQERAEMSLGMGGSGEPDEEACDIIAAPWEFEECAYLEADSSSMGGSE